MGAAKKKNKKKSLYDSFYGMWPDEIENNVNKAMRSVEEQMQEYSVRLDAMLKKNEANKKKKDMPIPQNDLEKLREMIRKGAKDNLQSISYGTGSMAFGSKSSINENKSNTPIISDVVRVKDLKDFTNDTHLVKLALKSADYYSEEITTKIVGMETVDWWEYILLYGFVKSLKLGYEYTKVKQFIDKGIKSTRTVSGQNLEITFVPKISDVKQNFDIVGGLKVIRETGTVYDTVVLCLEIPKKSRPETHEYNKGYFVYEDSFSTLVIDYDALNEQIEKMLIDCNIHPTLIEEIKLILKNGRLSAI